MKKSNVDTLLRQAIAHCRKDELDEARQVYEAILARFPGNKRAKSGLAKLLAQMAPPEGRVPPELLKALSMAYSGEQFVEMAEQARTLLERYPEAPEIWSALGAASKRVGQTDVALQAFRRAAELTPGDANAQYNLAVVLQQTGMRSEAIDGYRRTLECNSNHAQAHGNLGLLLNEDGQHIPAIEHLKTATRLQTGNDEAHHNLGVAYAAIGRLNDAMDSFVQALRSAPGRADTHRNLAKIYHERGDADNALHHYSQAAILDPETGNSFFLLGNIQFEKDALKDAHTSYLKALEISPNNSRVHNNLGNVYSAMGKLDLAIGCYTQATELDPDYGDAFYNLGKAFNAVSQPREAAQSYKRALDVMPSNAAALRALFSLPVEYISESALRHIVNHEANKHEELPGAPARLFLEARRLSRLFLPERAWAKYVEANAEVFRELPAERRVDPIKRSRTLSLVTNSTPPSPIIDPVLPVSLFIFGASRSGKTLVEAAIAQRSEIHRGFENDMLRQALLHTCQEAGLADEIGEIASLPKLLYPVFQKHYLEILTERFEASQIISTTVPTRIYDALAIAETIPNALFIFVRRNVIENAIEIFRTYYKTELFYTCQAQAAFQHVQWYHKMIEICEKRLGDRSITITFEDFVKEPRRDLKRISELVGVEVDTEQQLERITGLEEVASYRELFLRYIGNS